jgi:hypothetical protein
VIDGFLPTLHHDLAVFGIERDQDTLRSHCGCDFLDRRSEGRCSHDDPMRSQIHQALRSISSAHAPAHTAFRARGQQFHQSTVLALAHRGVKINHLNFREGCELTQHL